MSIMHQDGSKSLDTRAVCAGAGTGLMRGVAVGALALALAVPLGAVAAWAQGDSPSSEQTQVASASDLAQSVAGATMPSVGSVYALVASSGSIGLSSGSCIVIDPEGYILTNYHVVEGYDDTGYSDEGVIQVVLNNVTYEATVVGTDPTSDIALLHIDAGDTVLQALEFGDSDALTVGSWVMTVGCPYGEDVSVSQGIVSGISRSAVIDLENTQAYYVGTIQADAMMNQGSSGGAMVNADGQLVGMTTYAASTSGDWAGMSYAIPSNYIQGIVGQLRETGTAEHPQLGVKVANISDYSSLYREVGSSNVRTSTLLGAQVVVVTPESGAAEAGLLEGDVITALDGLTIYSAEDLIVQVRSHAIGETVTLTLVRDGEKMDVQVVLGSDATKVEETYSDGSVKSILDYIFGAPVDSVGESRSEPGFGFGIGFGGLGGDPASGTLAWQQGTAA